MSTITAAIIAKDEENMISECLRSVSFCDEILLIDGFSKDNTVTIAKKFHAKVIQYPPGDFSKLRNQALQQASSDWLFYIDADERISKELMVNIKTKVSLPNPKAAYRIRRKNYYFKKYEWPTVEKLERLFQKKALREWYGILHESPIVEGEIGEIDGYLLHFTHRDLSSMLDKTLIWSSIEASNRFNTNHPQMRWWRYPRTMLTAFYDSYIQQKGWKVGTPGLIESIYQSYSAFATYAKLWEMQEKSRRA